MVLPYVIILVGVPCKVQVYLFIENTASTYDVKTTNVDKTLFRWNKITG